MADVDVTASIDFHRAEGRDATMTVVQPPGRFGAVTLHEEQKEIDSFMEKPSGDGSWINGGYFVLEPSVIDRIEGDDTVWEQEPLRSLARDGELRPAPRALHCLQHLAELLLAGLQRGTGSRAAHRAHLVDGHWRLSP